MGVAPGPHEAPILACVPFPELGSEQAGYGQRPPPPPTGVSLACPEAPGINPVSSCGRHWCSPARHLGPSRTAVGQAVPPCLTTSLAHVGIFLEMRQSRAGDCGQAGWEGSTGKEADGQGRPGAGGGRRWGARDASSWCPVLGQTRPLTDPHLGKGPKLLASLNPLPEGGHLVSRRPLRWGPVKERTSSGKAASLGGAAGGCRPDTGWTGPCGPALRVSEAGGRGWGLRCVGTHWALSACEESRVGSGERWWPWLSSGLRDPPPPTP